MPGIFYEPSRRRDFLKATISAAGALTLAGCATTRKVDTGGKLHLALLSDTHVPANRGEAYRGFQPWENLKRIVPEVEQSAPEGVVICGDAARLEGLPGDYAELKGLLEPIAAKRPVYIAMGNHDDRKNFAQAFPQPGTGPAANFPAGAPAGFTYFGKAGNGSVGVGSAKPAINDKHVLVLEHDALRVVVLDSLMYVNKVAGLLGNAQRKWLADWLPAHKEKPVVLFVHHSLEDNDGDLMDTPRLFEILKPNRHVKAIFYGHSHVWGIKERQGVQLVNLPAVGYNFRDQDPVGWLGARFDAGGVDLTMHAFAGNRAEDGQTRRVTFS